jgi:hypothetical protein
MIKDYYRLLELPRYSRVSALKAAYRRLALQFHPDKRVSLGPQAQAAGAARMVELNEAISVLTDPVRRARYDQALRDLSVRRTRVTLTGLGFPRSAEDRTHEFLSRSGSSRNSTSLGSDAAAGKFQQTLRTRLEGLPLNWKEHSIHGWEWSIETDNSSRSLLVAYRHLPDPSLVSASGLEALLDGLVLERVRAPNLRTAIGVLSCQRIKSLRTVVRRFHSFAEQRPGWLKSVHPLLLLYNWQLRRMVRLGAIPSDPDVERVLCLAYSAG